MVKIKNENLNDIHRLEKYLRPQWGWRTFLSIFGFIAVYCLIYLDLEINLGDLLINSGNYLIDVLARMVPPDFSNLNLRLLEMLP